MGFGSAIRNVVVHFGQSLGWFIFTRLSFRSFPDTKRSSSDHPVVKPESSDFNIDSYEFGKTPGSMGLVASAEGGNILAAYGFRFIAMPLEYFHDVVKDQIDLTEKELGKRLYSDRKYERSVIEGIFFEKAKQGVREKGLELLKEEMFHHEHLRDTSTWAFIQSATLLNRFAQTYICLQRVRLTNRTSSFADADYLDAWKFFLNMSLVVARLKVECIPVIEGYARFFENDASPEIPSFYGEPTQVAKKYFDCIRANASAKYGAGSQILVNRIAKAVLDLPLISNQMLNVVSYEDFENKLGQIDLQTGEYLFSPLVRLAHVKAVLEQNLPDTLEECVKKIDSIIPISTNFERRWIRFFIWHITRNYIPPQIPWFMFFKVFISRTGFGIFSRLLVDMLRGGQGIEKVTYTNYPGLRMYSHDAQTIDYDPATVFFSGRTSTENLITSFEFIALGKRNARFYRYIQLQTLILLIITGKIIGYRYQDNIEFSFNWIPPLKSARAKVETWLNWLDSKCEQITTEIQSAIENGQKPFSGDTLPKFIGDIETLFWECENSLGTEQWKPIASLIYVLGDGLYMHGF